MNDQATKDDLVKLDKSFERKIDKAVEELLNVVQTFMHQVDERFNQQEEKFDRLMNTIDGFVGRIDKYETELAARDHQFEKLLAWARKVSKKTGIPLENL